MPGIKPARHPTGIRAIEFGGQAQIRRQSSVQLQVLTKSNQLIFFLISNCDKMRTNLVLF